MCNPNTLATLHAARLIANHATAAGIPERLGETPARQHFTHMGAVLCDAVLQAGLNYRTVVAKRTRRVIELFPYADTTRGVRRAVADHSVETFLDWTHTEKIGRFGELLHCLELECVQTVSELRDWIATSNGRRRLEEVRGVGPKTLDYISSLVGLERIAIDRHLRKFASCAGVNDSDYDSLYRSFALAADLLRVRRSHLDWWVWTTTSEEVGGRRQEELTLAR